MSVPAIVLLSGGLDSATTAAIAKADGFAPHALCFAYGQRHRVEVAAARRVSESLGLASFRVIEIDLRAIGGSALTADMEVPKDALGQESEARRPVGGIPVTYVPARNTIFLSYALACAEVTGAGDIFIGVNAVDYSGYPDCRPEYIAAFERMARLATRAGVEGTEFHIRTPLISMSKVQIIRRGVEIGVDYSLTHSCYDPDEDGRACGHCDSCLLRSRGFREAGVPDPTVYMDRP